MTVEITSEPRGARRSRLFCPMKRPISNVFFSLVDYRNNYFTSDEPSKIVEFYDGFENREQLIQWMKERPKGVANIHEVEGDKDIIVVIPTADFNGKYAKECRENIFKGLHMIFVESGGKGDFYFNYAHNCNVGIRKAMEYKPKWIVLSGDDMNKIDDISVLVNELEQLNNEEVKAVFTKPSRYHSIPCKLSKPLLTRNLLFNLLGKYRRMQLKLEKKFSVRFFLPPKRGYWRFFFGIGPEIISLADFGIFGYNLIANSECLFDETYINSAEDVDLSIRLSKLKEIKIIEFEIGDYVGSTLGTDIKRHLRDVAGNVYLNYKLENALL